MQRYHRSFRVTLLSEENFTSPSVLNTDFDNISGDDYLRLRSSV